MIEEDGLCGHTHGHMYLPTDIKKMNEQMSKQIKNTYFNMVLGQKFES